MTGYVRKDTTNNIADGNVINAADLDSEFDGVQDAFNASTGHKHDGTAGEGATINALGPTQDVTVSSTLLAPKTTNTVDIGSSALKFKDLFLAGNGSVGGTLAVTGVATFTAQPILSSLTASRAVFSDGSKGLVSNAITGTGNVVMSASPTLTGTVGGASLTLSSLTAGRVTYAGTSGLLQDDADLTFDGTTLSTAGLTASSTVTLSGGTANGVAYLNGSKVLTSGSALTFDGTNLGVGIASATSLLDVRDGVGSIFTLGNTGNFAAGEFSRIKWKEGSTQLADIGWEADTNELRINNRVAYTTFYASNAEALRLTSTSLYTASGINAGFGISAPVAPVTANRGNVSGAGQWASSAIAIANPTNTGSYSQISFGYTVGTTNASAYMGFVSTNQGTNGYGDLVFGTRAVNTDTQPTERLRLDSAGNLGLGVTPSAWSGFKAMQIGSTVALWGASSGAGSLFLSSNTYFDGTNFRYLNTANATFYAQSSTGNHAWNVAASGTAGNAISFTQAMTLDASSRLSVGTTSAFGQGTFSAGSNRNGLWVENDTYDYQTLTLYNKADANDNIFARFGTESSSFTARGSITYNRAGGLVAYNVTSDYRAKDISGPVTGSGALIDSVPVYMGKMKDATQERPMFLAHETPAYAHTGEKDAVDADGNPVYQQMDASALIPVMWAEIQSLRQRLSAANL